MGAERLDDVGKTVLDAEDRVFDLETPNFWHKQGEGRGTPSDHADRRRPSQTLRTTSTSPQSPAIGDNCLAKLVHPRQKCFGCQRSISAQGYQLPRGCALAHGYDLPHF